MTDNHLRWVVIGFAFLVFAAYMVWLVLVYQRVRENDAKIVDLATEYYRKPKAEPVIGEVVIDE